MLFLINIFICLNSNLVMSSSASSSSSSNLMHKSSTNTINNPLLDQLTAMLYHVENTKLCGNNLQKLNIDLEPLWSKKFKSQLQKSHHLANLLNNLFSQGKFDLDSKFLSSLSHFMLTTSTSDDESTINRTKDPYLIGYGIVLVDSNDKCLYISQTKNKTKDLQDSAHMPELYTLDKACAKINYKQENSPENTQDTSNRQYILNNDLNLNDADTYHNCFNWFKDFQSLYPDIQREVSANRTLNYQVYLEKILEKKYFRSRLFCGPFYECASSNSNLNNDWILIYSLPLFDREKRLKGSALIKLRLNQMDVNQCSNGDPIFAGTNKCKPNSECVFTPMKSFKSGNYQCRCPRGFLNNINNSYTSFDGSLLEQHYWLMKNQKNNSFLKMFNCLPCSGLECCKLESSLIDSSIMSINANNQNATSSVNTNENDWFFLNKGEYYSMQTSLFWSCRKYNMPLRYTIFFVQVAFVLITISIAVVIFYSRHNKIIKHSMWILLEIILFGAIMLYITLLVQLFEPTTNTCLAIPWLREMGFTIVFGILNLRLYKILIEFQSRKAHVVQLKDKDILRILFFIIVCVFGYLTAWTLVDLDYASEGFSLVTNTSLKGFIQYPICKIKWWDYFIEIAEFLFICVGFYLLYCTRTAPSEYNERKFISLVIYCEGIISTLLHIIKHSIFSSIHPDTILILYFVRCHTTVTVMILFIFFTKLFILIKPNSDEYCRSSRLSTVEGNDPALNSDSIKFQIGQGVANADFDNGDLNLNDLDQEEIRSELKRLYTQLHIYKTKSAKKDNPHLQSKRRGQHKKHRRFSNQLQKPVNNKDNESYHIKTPDESICSNDATNLPHSYTCSEDRDHSNMNQLYK